ncbi:hypothetical protein AAHE18_09G109600 [Arachis hypogaea]
MIPNKVTRFVCGSFLQVKIPNMEILKLFSINIHKIWSNPPSNGWFQNLIKLTLEDCRNLTYLC